jgi:hypothetical protein
VYLGGRFRHVRGRSRGNLAAVDASNGRLQPWQPRANAAVNALAIIAGTVYAGGDFTAITGTSRSHIAAIDAATGAPTAWDPGANYRVSALLATPAGLVAGGEFNLLGGSGQTGIGIFAPTGQALAPASNPLPSVMATPLRLPSLAFPGQR